MGQDLTGVADIYRLPPFLNHSVLAVSHTGALLAVGSRNSVWHDGNHHRNSSPLITTVGWLGGR